MVHTLAGDSGVLPDAVTGWFADLDYVEDVISLRGSLVLHALHQFALGGMKRITITGLDQASVRRLRSDVLSPHVLSIDPLFNTSDVAEWVTLWHHVLDRAGAAEASEDECELVAEFAAYRRTRLDMLVRDFSAFHPKLVGGLATNSTEDDKDDNGTQENGADELSLIDDENEDVTLSTFFDTMFVPAEQPMDMTDKDWESQLQDMFGNNQHASLDASGEQIREFIIHASHAIQMHALQHDTNYAYLSKDLEGNIVASTDSSPPTASEVALHFAGTLSTTPTEFSFPACRVFGRCFYVNGPVVAKSVGVSSMGESACAAWFIPKANSDGCPNLDLTSTTVTVTLTLDRKGAAALAAYDKTVEASALAAFAQEPEEAQEAVAVSEPPEPSPEAPPAKRSRGQKAQGQPKKVTAQAAACANMFANAKQTPKMPPKPDVSRFAKPLSIDITLYKVVPKSDPSCWHVNGDGSLANSVVLSRQSGKVESCVEDVLKKHRGAMKILKNLTKHPLDESMKQFEKECKHLLG